MLNNEFCKIKTEYILNPTSMGIPKPNTVIAKYHLVNTSFSKVYRV